ncbi:amino acid permease [Limosilactobacillus sp. STM2_1]|uniref:Amino acid permease n=2 Tax=Limosilactobacillus rudii TaxID=2759755 RepID=A0A7W3UM81_9LACO|nr:amino acid permease [Limosilactobacillus rudii]MBB1098173.1 amino acid permease [Limosilactobacillus rudii]MCD7135245.1 amino acid permease [Limosilactobacillus rudii]
MIALGGSIGTGLFVASGSAIHTAGPGGAIIGYAVMGIMVYFLMTSLGEMATFMPVSGSFATYCTKFIDPALGFSMGWIYWFNWALTVAVDSTTAGIVMNFWFPNIPSWLFSLAVLVYIIIVNALAVSSFGEVEYWLAIIKVITVILFLIVGFAVILGIMGGKTIGFHNLTYKQAPFVGGFPAILSVFLVAGFSFQGTELVGITAGESATPAKSIPRAIHSTFWRILLFYVLSIFVIACILPYTSPNLLGSSVKDITISPFTLVFRRAGLAFAASVMNAVILTAVISAANSGMYASTRMIYAMAHEGQAWRIFGVTNQRGIPIYGLLASTLVASLTFLTGIFGPGIYEFLIDSSGLAGFLTWMGMAAAHLRFRRALKIQGYNANDLRYHAAFYPVGPILALLLCAVVIIGQNPTAILHGNWQEVILTYLSVPLLFILWLYYKLRYRTHLVSLAKVDLKQGHFKSNEVTK